MKNELIPPIMGSLLNSRVNTYNLSNFQEFVADRKRTVRYGLETLSYQYPQLWSRFSETLKETNSPGAHGDIFTPFGTKALTQNLKSLPRGNQFLLC